MGNRNWSPRITGPNLILSWSAAVWPALRPRRPWVNSGITSIAFAFRIRPRRAHSIAAQGGINAAKNYQNDGDSVFRLFYDTIKGGISDRAKRMFIAWRKSVLTLSTSAWPKVFPSRASTAVCWPTVHSEESRSHEPFTPAVKLVNNCCWALIKRSNTKSRQARSKCTRGRKCSTWFWSTGTPKGSSFETWLRVRSATHAADAVVLATGGYGNVFYLSTNAKGCNVTATWRAHKRGALFANPCFTQIHPTCIPVGGVYQAKLTLMSESLRNDGRVWVPKKGKDPRSPDQIPEEDRDYYLERKYPSFGNLVPRDIASRNAKEVCDEGRGVGRAVWGFISISPTPFAGMAKARFENATAICSTCI